MSTLSFEQSYMTAQDVVLSAHVHRQACATKNVHFLHGNGFAVRTYEAMLEQFADELNLIVQDAQGHGKSPTGARFLGWNKAASNFLNVLRQYHQVYQDQPLVGVGHSFGGCMTLLMSARDPELFERTILLDPALYPPKMIWLLNSIRWSGLKRKLPLVRQTERRRTTWPSPQQAFASLQGRGTFKGWQDRCLWDYVRYAMHQEDDGKCHLNCPTWLEAAVFGSAPKGLWRLVKSVTTPTYIVYGDETYDMFKAAYQLAEQLNPNIRLIKVTGGHCFMLQYPEQTAALVKSIMVEGEAGAQQAVHAGFVVKD
ncbi:alpha/beta fold hydrolase [Marinomonas ostreistagni]|uniref:alpha/beta fold hydrolase n=1 Tax=Marinomonas ostreistagni TaxID=359209 RepID=UPI001951BD3B|nr:alpha/beta hydrolase [Marinomonas ostreistagni]